MRRREFISLIGGALTGFLRAARAEQAKVPRIGFLYPGPQALVAVRLEAMLNGLRAAGYSAPAQVELVVRVAEGDPARIATMLAEIIGQNVDVIFANGPAVLDAARSTTRSIPIVALDLETDPVGSGLIANLAHPGGNITGVFLDFPDFTAKWLELLKEKGAMQDPPTTRCCAPAPAVLEFDTDGDLLRSWGGPGEGYDWPKMEHGIFVDRDGNVWLAGNDASDHQILKFAPDGKFLQQIGKAGSTGGSNSETQLGRPAHLQIDEAANELYVADGYLNRRVLVLDSRTGAYKRHWGAYGHRPSDDKQPPYDPKAPLAQQFANPVHCVRLSNDGLVYVCDRVNDRIQVFRKDGAFVKEFRVEPQTLANGSVWDLVLSEDRAQNFIFIADGANNQIVTLRREDGAALSAWGRGGRMAGQFKWVHNIGIDSKGNLYTAEVGFGRRAQKFKRLD